MDVSSNSSADRPMTPIQYRFYDEGAWERYRSTALVPHARSQRVHQMEGTQLSMQPLRQEITNRCCRAALPRLRHYVWVPRLEHSLAAVVRNGPGVFPTDVQMVRRACVPRGAARRGCDCSISSARAALRMTTARLPICEARRSAHSCVCLASHRIDRIVLCARALCLRTGLDVVVRRCCPSSLPLSAAYLFSACTPSFPICQCI